MKNKIDPFDYAGTISKALKKGVLLTTKANGNVNTMSIGWGMVGVEWGKPVFIAFVRESRFTKKLLDQNGEFTINVPIEHTDANIIRFCGSNSGRNVDKFRALGLTQEDPEVISVPGIKELPLTLECKVIYRQQQDLAKLPEDVLKRFYPVDSENQDLPQDYHIAYYGEIVSAYIID